MNEQAQGARPELSRIEIFDAMAEKFGAGKEDSIDTLNEQFRQWERRWDAALFSEGTSFRKKLGLTDSSTPLQCFGIYLKSDLRGKEPEDYEKESASSN